MTDSSTPCCTSAPRRWCGVGLLLLALAGQAAEESAVTAPALLANEDAYLLNADFNLELNSRLEDVVARGVPLYFVVEFELTRPRWYWFDATLAARTLTYRLSFHALTRQYRLSTGPLHQSFDTLGDALGVVARLRNWPVASRSALQPGVSYEAALRLHLDLAQLPKPLQVTAFGSREWNVGSDWQRWSFTPSAAEAK